MPASSCKLLCIWRGGGLSLLPNLLPPPSPFPGFKCPVCSKSVASDEMEMHFIMCLSKPRLSYNGEFFFSACGPPFARPGSGCRGQGQGHREAFPRPAFRLVSEKVSNPLLPVLFLLLALWPPCALPCSPGVSPLLCAWHEPRPDTLGAKGRAGRRVRQGEDPHFCLHTKANFLRFSAGNCLRCCFCTGCQLLFLPCQPPGKMSCPLVAPLAGSREGRGPWVCLGLIQRARRGLCCRLGRAWHAAAQLGRVGAGNSGG